MGVSRAALPSNRLGRQFEEPVRPKRWSCEAMAGGTGSTIQTTRKVVSSTSTSTSTRGTVVCCIVVANTRPMACALPVLLFSLGSGSRRILQSLTQHRPAVRVRPAQALNRATGILCRALRFASSGLRGDQSLVFHELGPMATSFRRSAAEVENARLAGGEQTSASCRCGQRSRGAIRRWLGSNRGVVLFPTFGGLTSTANR